jgi:hypothetical protein
MLIFSNLIRSQNIQNTVLYAFVSMDATMLGAIQAA